MSGAALQSRVEAMMTRLEREDVCMHGFILSVDGREKASAYYAPFREGQPHRMYSVSKTFTALALSFLLDEGKAGLDDRIVDFFPDYLPEAPEPWLCRLTIRDMLRMATCFRSTAYREGVDEDWTRPFFTAPATHAPGAVFYYDTGCSQALAALVKRLSGMEAIDLLNRRLFPALGADDKKYWLRDPSGACQGGTGLCMSLRDLHKTAWAVMQDGAGILPAWFCREMGRCHIATPMQTNQEERFGYGWQCWRTRAGWAMYGLGGQLAVCCPDKRALFSTIADTRLDPVGVQRIYDAFFEEVYPFIGAEDMPPVRYEKKVIALAHDPACERSHPGVYCFEENMLGFKSLELRARRLIWENARGRCELPFGLGENVETPFPGWPEVPALSSGGWLPEDQLRVRCFAIGNAPCGIDLLLSFREDGVTVQARNSFDPITNAFNGVATGYLRS